MALVASPREVARCGRVIPVGPGLLWPESFPPVIGASRRKGGLHTAVGERRLPGSGVGEPCGDMQWTAPGSGKMAPWVMSAGGMTRLMAVDSGAGCGNMAAPASPVRSEGELSTSEEEDGAVQLAVDSGPAAGGSMHTRQPDKSRMSAVSGSHSMPAGPIGGLAVDSGLRIAGAALLGRGMRQPWGLCWGFCGNLSSAWSGLRCTAYLRRRGCYSHYSVRGDSG